MRTRVIASIGQRSLGAAENGECGTGASTRDEEKDGDVESTEA